MTDLQQSETTEEYASQRDHDKAYHRPAAMHSLVGWSGKVWSWANAVKIRKWLVLPDPEVRFLTHLYSKPISFVALLESTKSTHQCLSYWKLGCGIKLGNRIVRTLLFRKSTLNCTEGDWGHKIRICHRCYMGRIFHMSAVVDSHM